MKNKKTIIVLLLAWAMSFAISANAYGAGIIDPDSATPSFFDDFEEYKAESEANYDPKEMKSNWHNGFLYIMSDGRYDSECDDTKYAIVNFEGNKVLHLRNKNVPGSTFFYVAPKGIRTKDFEYSFSFYPKALNGSWIGMSIRKTINTRFNGCDNVMFYLRFSDPVYNDKLPEGSEQISLQVLRGVGGSSLDDTANIKGPGLDPLLTEDDPLKSQMQPLIYLYNPNDSSNTNEPVLNTWHTFKVVADGNHFRIYLDGNYIAYYYNNKASANNYGYASINACIADVYIDDVSLENNDTEPAPPIDEEEYEEEDGEQNEEEHEQPANKGCKALTFGGTFIIIAGLLGLGLFKKQHSN